MATRRGACRGARGPAWRRHPRTTSRSRARQQTNCPRAPAAGRRRPGRRRAQREPSSRSNSWCARVPKWSSGSHAANACAGKGRACP
eukprot:9499272-Pyramimonas_sp.AAC.1